LLSFVHNKKQMIETPPHISEHAQQHLQALGATIRARRKALKLNATLASETAAMSRVTWHRIEKGEPSVTAGAYASALQVLGLVLASTDPTSAIAPARTGFIPALIPLQHYPRLQQLAWHVKGNTPLTAREAFDIYARNQRHLAQQTLVPAEQALFDALQIGFGGHVD
jgi:transcriptional regulator with XRE-family HTH domain